MQIGIDFGGTKIEGAVLDRGGQVIARHRLPNPGSYDAALETVRELVARLEASSGAGTIGIGTPGSESAHTGRMRNCNTVWLNGRALRADLEARLGRPVRLANDADCLALSEASDGAAAGAATVFGVILGTGCGGGVVVHGELLRGANGIAGEWGHNPLPRPGADEHPGPACWCGRRGCIETWLCGPALARDHLEHAGMLLTPQDIVRAARRGEVPARATLARYIDRLGRALASVCNGLDPAVIVFGGGLSNIRELYADLAAHIAPHVFADAWSARLVPARWGDSSGVRGAARLWPTGSGPRDEVQEES